MTPERLAEIEREVFDHHEVDECGRTVRVLGHGATPEDTLALCKALREAQRVWLVALQELQEHSDSEAEAEAARDKLEVECGRLRERAEAAEKRAALGAQAIVTLEDLLRARPNGIQFNEPADALARADARDLIAEWDALAKESKS